MNGTPYLSVVLPCYNEGLVIEETHRRVSSVCLGICRPYEIIVVNDGSEDDSWSKLERMWAKDPNLVAVNLSRNHGHQLALTAGLHFARGERILIMDADLQDPPELLVEMLAKMDQGAEVVYAQRRSRAGDAPLKRLFCAVYYRCLRWLADGQIQLDSGDFRLINRRVADLIVAMPECHRFIRGMVSWVGYRQEAVIYDRGGRFAGETKYPFGKLARLAIDGLISSSLKPLRFSFLVGGAAAVGSGLLGLYALASWLFVRKTPQGWTSILLAVVFFGGMQLFILGILGEYVGRTFEQVRGRPLFMVDRVLRGPTPPAETPRAKPAAP
jgi:dolichol-phosphate mannosyltransferase